MATALTLCSGVRGRLLLLVTCPCKGCRAGLAVGEGDGKNVVLEADKAGYTRCVRIRCGTWVALVGVMEGVGCWWTPLCVRRSCGAGVISGSVVGVVDGDGVLGEVAEVAVGGSNAPPLT